MLVGALAACGKADDTSAADTAQAADTAAASWLFVLQGEVTAVADGTLTMSVPHSVVAFTDRPERQTQLMNVAAFVDVAWAEDADFRSNPPNASLIDEANRQIDVVEIQGMTLDGDVLTVTYRELNGGTPAVGDFVALTIDAFPTSVNGQITDFTTDLVNPQITDNVEQTVR